MGISRKQRERLAILFVLPMVMVTMLGPSADMQNIHFFEFDGCLYSSLGSITGRDKRGLCSLHPSSAGPFYRDRRRDVVQEMEGK